VFVEPTGRRIQPFDDPIGATPILNRPLQEWQAEAFSDADLIVVPTLEPPCLVVPDTLFAAGAALRAFIEGAADQDAVFILGRSQFASWSTPVQPDVHEVEQGYMFDAIRFVTQRGASPRPIVVDPQERVVEVPVPPQYTGEGKAVIALARRPVLTLHHWVHVLWANQAAQAYQTLATPLPVMGLRLLWAVLRARSFNRWKVLRRFSTHGRGCDIHPSAIIEGSTLGNRVTVGANARVLFSHIGDGANIGADAQVEVSVVGERSWIPQQTVIRGCVLYPEAVVTGLTQQSVFGRMAMTTASAIFDLNFDRDVRVELDGQLVSSGQRILGAALGHDTRLGAGVTIASGRSIPNGYFIVADAAQAASKIPAGLAEAGTLIVRDGVLGPMIRREASSGAVRQAFEAAATDGNDSAP
jgi:carbonic anhydrase/acetyltransferase-like protein (isoleucine patch superfamily)